MDRVVKLSVGEISAGEISVGGISVGEISVGEISCGQYGSTAGKHGKTKCDQPEPYTFKFDYTFP